MTDSSITSIDPALSSPAGRAARLLLLAAGGGGIAIAVGIAKGDGPVEQAMLAARYTARVSLALFLPLYLAAALARLAPGPASAALVRDRRWWGLAFALAHVIHLAALVTYFRLSGDPPHMLTLVGGGFGYAVLAAMTVSSLSPVRPAAGLWRGRLHAFGLHYLWLVFAFTYFGRLFDRPDRFVQGAIGFAVTIAAGAIRLLAARRRAL